MSAIGLIQAARVVLLDFDGPVTPLMPSPLNVRAADLVRGRLRSEGADLPQEMIDTADHLELLRWANLHAPEALASAEQAAEEVEVQDARLCVPTPGGHDLIVACARTARSVVIVSNNTPAAIDTYLDRWGLRVLITAVVGRQAGHPELMKPHPHPVEAALRAARSTAQDAVMIGDSVSDIVVARAVGVPSIGYAKTPHRGSELSAAGATAITDQMATLAAISA